MEMAGLWGNRAVAEGSFSNEKPVLPWPLDRVFLVPASDQSNLNTLHPGSPNNT